jgi:2-polyprenyl-3-methyl-5-hydroxy-6-metoxy-1,4-benzoquinol methylase
LNTVKTTSTLPQDDLLYYAGTAELTEKLQKKFIPYFIHAPGRVLEIGCGKGVVLSLLKKKEIDAYGIDLSETAVQTCREKGLEAICTDLLLHMQQLPAASLGGIFCAHVIEHLMPDDAMAFIKQAYRVLIPSGKLILITPNAKDIRTTERFWLDVTHVRPYPEKLLHVLLQRDGFKNIYSYADQEAAKNIVERIVKTCVRWWFFGYMFVGDLVVVAER